MLPVLSDGSNNLQVQCINQPGVLPSSSALKLLPLLVLSALKSPAFRCVSKPPLHCCLNLIVLAVLGLA